MRIMATGMHDAWILRFVGHFIRFNDRQGIHVCTKGHYLFSWIFSLNKCRPTGSCFRLYLGNPHFFQLVRNESCSLKFLERKPTLPAGIMGMTCCPRIELVRGFSSTLSLIIRDAPPGIISSPGWKISLIVPSNWSLTSYKIFAAPSKEAVCASWPQACMTPGF